MAASMLFSVIDHLFNDVPKRESDNNIAVVVASLLSEYEISLVLSEYEISLLLGAPHPFETHEKHSDRDSIQHFLS